MPGKPIRLGYAVEFLLALMVVLFAWGDLAGSEHIDFIPWYWRFLLAAGFSAGVVQTTRCMVEAERAWNPRSFLWLLAALTLAAAMGAITYHYRSLEPVEDETDTTEEGPATQTRGPARSGGVTARSSESRPSHPG